MPNGKNGESNQRTLSPRLPAQRQELSERRRTGLKLKLVDHIDRALEQDGLLEDPKWRAYQEALSRDTAVEGNLIADDHYAAARLREWAIDKYGPSHPLSVAKGKLVVRATKSALRRFDAARSQRQAAA